jgi:flagellar hook-length control protein FliK
VSPTAPPPIPTAEGALKPLPSGAPPGAPPEGPPFHSALETEWARTAIAEGRQQPRSQHSGHRAATTPYGSKATAGPAPSAPTPAGSAPTPAALPGGTPANQSAATATASEDVHQSLAARLDTSSPDRATARGGALSGGEEGVPETSAAVAHDDALPSLPTSPPTDRALAASRDVAPTTDAPVGPKNDILTGSEIASALSGAPQNASTAGAGVQVHSTPKVPPTGDLAIPHGSPAPAANRNTGDLAKPPSVSVPSAGTNAGGEVGGLETTTSPLVPAAATGNPAGTLAELGSGAYGVGLQEAIESLHGTIQLAARQGLTQARISLQPEELGEIRINLTQTAQGLLARVTAESPAAAQALAGAHAQLRQSLSSLGINLTRLDIGHHDPAQSGGANAKGGGGQGGAARGESFTDGRPGRPTAIAALADPETETDSPVAEEPAPATIAPPNGTLIDVLA